MVENFFYVSGIYKEDELRKKLEEKESAGIDELTWPIKRRIVMKQSNHSRKAIVLEEIEVPEEEKRKVEEFYQTSEDIYQWDPEELRIGYWIVNRDDQWQWGQSSLLLPARDLEALIGKAIEHGFIKQAP